MSRRMKETAPGTFLVWDEPLPIGRTFASGSAVYLWRDGRWTCDGHRAERDYPPAGSSVPDCEHIEFVKGRHGN
jgi:hypothetical protein